MKRGFDLVAVLITLPVWGGVVLLLSVMVRIKMGGPIFFPQTRPGLNEKPFKLIKFRTMRSGEGSDAERLTGFGQFLRRTSLDELPELLNVLRGDMSLVGPRPLLMRYLSLYSARQKRRHEVRPGITGWAQVNGRNAISWEQKFEYDVWYVENRSFGLDLKILFLTVAQVLQRKNISAEGEATMPEFKG